MENKAILEMPIPIVHMMCLLASDVGKVCVYLISTENVLNSLNRKDTVLSNKVCII